MSDIAIRVRDLGKEYRIGAKAEGYKTLRESLVSIASSPMRLFQASARRHSDERIWALRDVSFEVRAGEVVGVIGRNGAGKSTLLKILARITEPTRGSAEIHGRVGSLLEVGTGFHPELTGRENVYLNGAILGMRRFEIDRKFDQIVAFSEIEQFIDTPVKKYSSGMYLRLAFSVAAHLDPEILLVDEVLAVGDAQFQAKCLGRMRTVAGAGRTILFVSHNMEAIASLCSRCIVIDDGKVKFYGPSDAAVSLYYEWLSRGQDQSERHMLYVAPPASAGGVASITRIEILDSEGRPHPLTRTWDDVVFRMHYAAREEVPSGSVIIDIRDMKNQRLLVLDSGLRIPLRAGNHHVDCAVPRLPLAAGQFFLGAGLGRANGGWIWRDENLAPFRVHSRDVLGLGRAPSYTRMAFVVQQAWKEEDGVQETNGLNGDTSGSPGTKPVTSGSE